MLSAYTTDDKMFRFIGFICFVLLLRAVNGLLNG